MPIAVYALPVVGIQHLMAPPVAKFVCLQISYRVMWTLPQVEQVVQCTGRG